MNDTDRDRELISLSTLRDSVAGRSRTATGGRLDSRVTDFVVDLAGDPSRVLRTLVGAAGGQVGPTEVALLRDVLDAPAYDARQARTVRVGEVWLADVDNGLRVLGLETDSPSVWARLVPLRCRRHRPGPRRRLLSISDLHLVSRHGHAAQLAAAGSAVHRFDTDELAGLLTSLPVDRAAEVVQRLPAARGAAAIGRLHPHVAARLWRSLDTAPALTPRRSRRTAGWRLNRPLRRESTTRDRRTGGSG